MAPSPHSSKIEELVHATPAERRARVEDIVRNALGGVLRLPAEHIDRQRHFGSLGLDSIMGLELRNRLESALQRPLSATLAWNYPTVDALAAYLDRLVAPDAAPATSPDDGSAGVEPDPEYGDAGLGTLLAQLTSLTDDDAARALREVS
jgi:myxalamid-type polyketide synthase MxaE and MxaD